MPRSLAPAGLALAPKHHRAGAVAEQHAGRAVGPVEDAREGLGADDQRLLRLAGLDQRVGGGRAHRRSRSRPPAGRRRRRASCRAFPGRSPPRPGRCCPASRSPARSGRCRRPSAPASASAAPRRRGARGRRSARRRRRCGARGCRCAGRSTRRRCRPSSARSALVRTFFGQIAAAAEDDRTHDCSHRTRLGDRSLSSAGGAPVMLGEVLIDLLRRARCATML